MKCKEHPRYNGLYAPKVACAKCWQKFFGISDTCINCGCQQNEVECDKDGNERVGDDADDKWVRS